MKKTKIITLFTLGFSVALLTPIITVACGAPEAEAGDDKTKPIVMDKDNKNMIPAVEVGMKDKTPVSGNGQQDKTPGTNTGTETGSGASDKNKNPGTNTQTPTPGTETATPAPGVGTDSNANDKDKTSNPNPGSNTEKDKPVTITTISTEENKKNALLDLENAYLNLRRQDSLVLSVLDRIIQKNPFISESDPQEKKDQSDKDIAELIKFAAKIRNHSSSLEAIKTSVDTLKTSKIDNSENFIALKQQIVLFFTQFETDYFTFMSVIDPTQTREKIKIDINKLDQTIFVSSNIVSLKNQNLTLLDVASLIDIIGGDEIGSYLTQNIKSERPLGQVARKAIRLINLAVKNIFQKIAVSQIIEKKDTTFETLATSFKKHEKLVTERKLKPISTEFTNKVNALSPKIEQIKNLLSTITFTDPEKERQLSQLKINFDFVETGYLGHRMSSADGQSIQFNGLSQNFKKLDEKINTNPTNLTTNFSEINTAYKNSFELSSIIKEVYFNFSDVSLNTASALRLTTTLSNSDAANTNLTSLKNLLTELDALVKPLSESTETVFSIINNVSLFASVPSILLTQAAIDIIRLTPVSDYLLETVLNNTVADIEKQM